MTFNPYEVLDVPRTASPAEIKRAYRKKAKQSHPDAGGTSEEFTRLAHSQLILLDPARRERFDRSGTIDPTEPDNALSRAVSITVGFLASVVQQHVMSGGPDPTQVDLIAEASRAFKQNLESFAKERKKIERHADKLAAVEKRLRTRKKTPGSDFLRQALVMQLATVRQPLHEIEKNAQGFRDALLLLDDFSFEVDKVVDAYGFSMTSPPWMRTT